MQLWPLAQSRSVLQVGGCVSHPQTGLPFESFEQLQVPGTQLSDAGQLPPVEQVRSPSPFDQAP